MSSNIIHLLWSLVVVVCLFVCVRSILTVIRIVVWRGLVLLLYKTTDSKYNTLLENRRIAVNIICLLVAIHYVLLLCIVTNVWGVGGTGKNRLETIG